MSDSISIRALSENMILFLLTQGARSVGEVTKNVEFTRHDSRVRRLLSDLGKTDHVAWDEEGDWRITHQGLSRLQMMESS